jgi:1-acyl-sn-glycerol-3-phosphate acyltransferase
MLDAMANPYWYEFCRGVFRTAAAVGLELRYSGRENIPAEGPVLVLSNHQSHFDPPLVGAGVPRQMHYLARDTLYGFAPFDWLIRSLNAIPIDREGGGLAGIRATLRVLKAGGLVLMFPEGTRTRDGSVGPFRPGFTTLAVRGRAAILPVAMEGAHDAWPRHRKLPRPGTVHVHYCPPVLPDDVAGYDEPALLAELETRVRHYHGMLRERAVFARKKERRGT